MKVKVKSGDDEKDGKQIEDLKTLPQIAEPPVKGRFRKQISRSRQEKTKRNSRASPSFKRSFEKKETRKRIVGKLLNTTEQNSFAVYS